MEYRSASLRKRAWALYLIVAVVGAVAYMWAPGVAHSGVFFNILGFSSVVAIVVGVRWHRPKSPGPWYLLALGQAFFVSGDVLAYNYERFFHHITPFPSIADALYLAVYPCLIAGLLLMLRRRSPGGDRASLLDALILTLGASLVSWVYLIGPIARIADLPALTRVTLMAYPIMDLGLLAVLVRLAVGSGARVISFRLLVYGAGALLVADAAYAWMNVHGYEYQAGNPLDLVWLGFYFLWGAAALHPSMRELDRRAAPAPPIHAGRRLAILGAAALLGPLVETIQTLSRAAPEALVVAGCTAGMFVFVIVRLHGAMVDAGVYRESERLAREAERKYRSLVEGLPAIVYIADGKRDGAWHYVSPQILGILGYTPEEFVADPSLWEQSLDPDDREHTIRERDEAKYRGRRLRCEYRIHARSGKVVWIREEAASILDDDGNRTLRQGVMYDITDIKRAEEALVGALTKEREAATHLRALDEMKTSFLQAISHDLRTPLTTILGSALTLEREDLVLSAEDTRDLARRIAANSRRLSRLLTNLLDLDRISRGIVEPNRQFTELASIAQAALEGMLLDGRDLRLDVASVRADVDGAQVERIIENLVVNAIRYTPPGTPIELSIGPADGGLLIQVDDRGPGVPEEIRGLIFEPFGQGSATHAHAPAVGIGLSLVARFAQLHGGRAWVEDRTGGGASFRVWLDARIVAPDDPAHLEEAEPPVLPPRPVLPTPREPVSSVRRPAR